RNGKKSEIVLAITPRLVGKTRLANAQSMEFWTGTENTLRSAPFALRKTGSVSMSSGLGAPSAARTVPVPPPARPGTAPGQPAAAAAQTMSFSWQGPAYAKVGDKFTLMLNAQSAEAVRNLGVVVSFDPAVLKAVDAVEGSFLKAGNSGSNFTRDIDQGGQVTIDAANSGEQGAKGSGSVAAITFEVLAAAPQAQITLATAAPSGVSGEALAFAPPAPHSMALNP